MKKLIFVWIITIYSITLHAIDNPVDKINDIFARIPPDRIIELLIERERKKFITNILASQEPAINSKDAEAHLFEPIQPQPLSDQDKNIPVKERISKKYIGDIPGKIKDIIYYFSNHEKCIKNNIDIHNRLLLHGNPGTGKSYLIKVLSEELQVPCFFFSASFFADKYIGESSRRIRKAFNTAKEMNKPVLLFIDEIDALAAKRKDNTHNEHRSALITLLTEMQELQHNKNVIIVAATNDLKALDPAIKDRFAGSICEIKDLNVEQRAKLFQKLYADKGTVIEPQFAQRLATVINTTSYDEDTHKYKANFSNRDVENIVVTSLFRKFAECDLDSKKGDKHLCNYVREVIDETGKKASFGLWSEFCKGI